MYLGLHPPCWELHAGRESISFPHRLSYYSSLIIFYTSTSLNSWGGYFFVCENSRFKSFGHPMLLHSTRYYIPLQCSWYPKWHFPCLLALFERNQKPELIFDTYLMAPTWFFKNLLFATKISQMDFQIQKNNIMH